MKYLSVKEIAALWNTSERSVRNYCAAGRVPGAFLTGKTWTIPENAEKPERSNKSKPALQTLADILKEEKRSRTHGGIYHKVQVELTYLDSCRYVGGMFLRRKTQHERSDTEGKF